MRLLVQALKYSDDEYRMGTTKIFIRLPKTLFRTEDAYQVRAYDPQHSGTEISCPSGGHD